MAGSASDYAENKIAELIVGKTAFALPTVWVALCTSAPGEAGSAAAIAEVPDANAYARKSTTGSDWTTAVAGAISNAAAITFVQASGSWGTVTHFALVDSGTWGTGHVLAWGDLTTPKAITLGDTPQFAIGELDITVT